MKPLLRKLRRLSKKPLRYFSICMVAAIFFLMTVLPLLQSGDCARSTTAGDARCLESFSLEQVYYQWDPGLCSYLDKLFRGQTVLEIGAGFGFYGRCFRRDNALYFPDVPALDEGFFLDMNETGLKEKAVQVKSWVGYDAPANLPTASEGLVLPLDVSSDFFLTATFDWALALDAHRLLASNEAKSSLPRRILTFCRNLGRHVQNGVVLSLAHPATSSLSQNRVGKRGRSDGEDLGSSSNSLDLQHKLDAALERFGFVADRSSQLHLRNSSRSPWFRQFAKIYVRVDNGWEKERF